MVLQSFRLLVRRLCSPVALGLPRWVPNLVLRQHADSPPLALRMQDLAIRFWIKHISLDVWSSMWDYLHATDETDPLGSVNMWHSITELFDEFEGDIDHLLRFQAPEPLPPGLVSFHSPTSLFWDQICTTWDCLLFWGISGFNHWNVHCHPNRCFQVLWANFDCRLFYSLLFWVSGELYEFCVQGRSFSYWDCNRRVSPLERILCYFYW